MTNGARSDIIFLDSSDRANELQNSHNLATALEGMSFATTLKARKQTLAGPLVQGLHILLCAGLSSDPEVR